MTLALVWEFIGTQTFHLGCDETSIKLPLCTLAATKAVEVAVSEAVHGFKNDGAYMWPMGWEEFHWRTNASNTVGTGPTGAIIEAWSKYKAADVVKAGYRAVEADGGKFYLNHLHPISSQWHDIGVGIETAEEKALMLGGEICMLVTFTCTPAARCMCSCAHPPDWRLTVSERCLPHDVTVTLTLTLTHTLIWWHSGGLSSIAPAHAWRATRMAVESLSSRHRLTRSFLSRSLGLSGPAQQSERRRFGTSIRRGPSRVSTFRLRSVFAPPSICVCLLPPRVVPSARCACSVA